MNQDHPYVSKDFVELDQLMESSFPPGDPGAVVLVQKKGEVLLRKGYGIANLEWELPVTRDTVFRIGSVTKQFTAVAILMLREQHKLALDDPIEKFFPSYPTHGHMISVEHLLTHTSGIKSYTGMKEWLPVLGKDFKLDELIDFFKFQPMEFVPGTRFSYNNSGYILLTAIIEKVSGKSFDQFLQENIFQPIKMEQTYLDLPGKIFPRRASGYSKGQSGWSAAEYISMTQPLGAGGMVSCVGDLALWDAALDGEQLLSAASLQQAHTAYHLKDGTSTHYGYGWFVESYQGLEIVEHAGGIPGFVCQVTRVPSTRTLAVVLMNQNDPKKTPNEICFRSVLHAHGLVFPEPKPFALDSSTLKEFEGAYEIEPGVDVVFSLKEDSLWITWPGEARSVALQAVGPEDWVDIKHPLGRIHFFKDNEGSVTGFEMRDQYGHAAFTKASRKADVSANSA